MPRRSYAPRRGDVVWLTLDPVSGHEQRGHRPVLVLTGQEFNQRTGLAIVCPMTSKVKGTLFEVSVSGKEESAVLVHQVRTIDWAGRGAKFKSKVSAATLTEVLARLATVLSLPVDFSCMPRGT